MERNGDIFDAFYQFNLIMLIFTCSDTLLFYDLLIVIQIEMSIKILRTFRPLNQMEKAEDMLVKTSSTAQIY